MTFPQTALPITVELDLAGTWTDISTYVYTRADGGITLNRGRQNESSAIQPGTCSFQLNNRDGRFSPRNPNGAYYGQIGRNTPVRVSVALGNTFLSIPSGTTGDCSTPNVAQVQITGDLDARIECYLNEWDTWTFGGPTLCGKYDASGQRSWFLGMDNGGLLVYAWSTDGTSTNSAGSTVAMDVPACGKYAIRVTHQVNNGAGGNTVTFYTGPGINGPWTQLGSPIVASGTTSIFNSTSLLRVGHLNGNTSAWDAPQGRINRFQLYSGINGTLVANPDFTAQASGASSFTDSTGLTWTPNSPATITNKRLRFYGEIPSWPASWTGGGADQWIDVQAAGIMRRLNQGNAPINSPLRRSISRYTLNPVLGYWPLEDGALATQATSALNGGTAGVVTQTVKFAQSSSLASSDALPTFTSPGVIAFTPTKGSSSSGWWIEFVYNMSQLPATTNLVNFVTVQLTGGAAQTVYIQPRTAGVGVQIVDGNGKNLIAALYTASSGLTAFVGGWARFVLWGSYSAGSTTVTAEWAQVGVPPETYYSYANTYSGTAGTVSQVTVGAPDSTLSGLSVGHVGVFDAPYPGLLFGPDPYYDVDQGYAGEASKDRVRRICTEQGVAFAACGSNTNSENLGAQTDDTFINLVQGAADADDAILMEQRENLGLQFDTRASLYNQTPTAVFNFTGGTGLVEPLTPVDDDQLIANDVTVNRTGGSGTRVVQTSGALSTAAPPNGVGVYQTSVDRNLFLDSQTAGLAQWLVYLGTWNEPRWPTVSAKLQNASSTTFMGQAADIDTGSIIEITGMPENLAPDNVVLLVQGYQEFLNQYRWEFTWNCSPGQPWYVATADDPVYGHADTDGSTIASTMTSTQTSISLATTGVSTGSPLWTTSGADFPFDILAGGERMTMVCPGTCLSPDPTATSIANWKGQNASAAIDNTYQWDPGVNSLLMVPNGSATVGLLPQNSTGVGSITPSATYQVMCWVYSPQGWTDLRPVIDWYNSAGTFLSTSLGSSMSLAAGTWTFMSQDLTAPASASQAYPRVRAGTTPPTTLQVWTQCLLMYADSSVVSSSSPQPYTVVRSVNGVAIAQSAGTSVALAYPAYAAL
jgi:hypothetical protein